MKTLHLAIIVILILLITQTVSAQPGRVFFGSQQPQITVSGNKVDLVWDYFNPDDSLYLITSNDSGTSFGEKIKLNRNSTWDMGFGSLVINENNVYHVWGQPSTGTQIFFIKSTDYGFTFTEPLVIAGNPNTLQQVEIDKFFVSGNYVYVVWSINHFVGNQNVGTIFLSKSADGGLGFDKPIQLSERDTNWTDLDAITSGDKIYFIWQSSASQECAQDNCKIQVHVRSMENNTLSEIHAPITLDNPWQVKISASENNLYLTGVGIQTDSLDHLVNGVRTYYENATTLQWIFFSKSSDGGITFGKVVNLSGSRNHCTREGNNGLCEIAGVYSYASGTNIYIIWNAENYTKNALEAFFIGSKDNGNTFGKVRQLNPYNFDNVVCEFVQQCINIQSPQGSNGIVYLAWSAGEAPSGSGYAIFAKSTDGGNTFDYIDISNKTRITQLPVISLGDGTIYVAGTRPGFQEGNHEFFAKSVDGGSTFSDGIDLDLQKEASVPEFPFVIPILLINVASVIAFYRIKSRK